ncbi:hypothetical protein SLEP1_g35639 [Rubroshorea leprosula]|uniref:Uncharacterized protein n=1 Tax=Rubroshorea leprosula TaxID=152421 RepID=A0AAV5KP05_9ROSI|nr:hypothetical protein SLEP1_g35639 [Rubroshorea leprosula]
MESTRVTARGAATGKEGDYRQWQGHRNWFAVTGKEGGYRQRRWNRNRVASYDSQFSGWTTTFFFANFSEDLEAKFLWNCFQRYGKVVDVFIPSKRDKRGKRFGFVRMAGVKNEFQMEGQLNTMWIGTYKIKVRIADERQRKPAQSKKIEGSVKDHGSSSKMNRLVQPGQSYAQAVKAKGKREDKAPIQTQDKDEEETAVEDEVKERAEENMVVEYTPSGEDLKWLEGGMVAVVRSLALISEIQESFDIDGGSISLSPIGGRRVLLTERVVGYLSEYRKINEELFDLWFESIKPWEMAPEETSRMAWLRISGVPLKAWGEGCFQRIESRKIEKRIKLKVGDQLYELEIVEEEWRSDPDWWLSENDRKSDQKTESDEYSVAWSQNEDPAINVDGICEGDDVNSDSVQLMKDMVSNLNLKCATGMESWKQSASEKEVADDESDGRAAECGLQRLSLVGPGIRSGPVNSIEIGGSKELSLEGPNINTHKSEFAATSHKTENRVPVNKKHRPIQACYPERMEEIRAKVTPTETARTRQSSIRRVGDQQAKDDKVHIGGSMSISDGCIKNRNRVIHREMDLYEVRRMMRVGKRLGIQFDENDEEIQFRLLEAEFRERAGRSDGLGIISFNVRGLGGTVKRKEVGKLVREERPEFLFLQETKLEKIDVGICKLLWYSDEFEWVAKASSGASGGLLCLWDRRHFVKREEFSGDGYVGISGEWGVNKQQCSLINVYGPNDRQKRAKLWEEMKKMVIEKEGRWLIAGDFNAVRGPEERRGKSEVRADMRDFDEFIETTGLVDIKLTNRRYTWYKPDGTARSRLDRFLLSTEMNNLGGEWIQQGLPRNISDHCAMVLKSKTTDWGPRPFRVLDAWKQHPDFKKAVEDKWREMAVEGYAGYKCQQKLKLLKEFLRGWNKEVFGNMEAQYVQAVKKIEQIDMQNEEADLEDFEIAKRQEGFDEMWDVLRKRELILKQKSRSKWVREGDANSRFFHRVANGRKAQNSIAGLMCDGGWIEDPDTVKNEAVKYFRSCFQGDSWNRPKPKGIKFKKISEEKKEWLERPFTVEEIEEVLRSCDGSKAPGPDGFNFNFLKSAWLGIKEDFISFFSEFHQNGKLVRGLNSSFLALVPKKLNAVNLKDYRPISLIGCVYKLLAKVLANRLKSVMSDIVSETQSAFVGGRQLIDSVLVLNEVVDEIKNRKQPAFVFKADFEKAYDCVDWSFLDWMMDSFGFGIKWRGWIMECLSTARISILVNGSPTREFEVGKGLRQGDPLSPFLFLMIGEGLQGLVQKAVTEGMLHGIVIGKNGLNVSLLQFADTIFMGRADAENIRMVKDVLRWFEIMSGLRINFNKSSIYGYNVSERWLKGSAGMLRCGVGRAPFLYLGLPIDSKSGSKKVWEPMVKKLRAKLVVWKANTLSFGGRLILLNSVLSALPIFYMSLFLLPKSVLVELMSIQRRFLWGGPGLNKKISWVKWDCVCRDKAKGGLGVPDLLRKNWALLGKWWYRFGDGVENLWKRVVREKYYGGRSEVDITAVEYSRVSKMWRDIIKIGGQSLRLRNMLVEGFKWEVGEGNKVDFWQERWVGDKTLRDLCPRLYALAVRKEGKVSEMGKWDEGRWVWRVEWRRGTIGREKDEEGALEKALEGVKLKEGVRDVWKWRHEMDGKYVVGAIQSGFFWVAIVLKQAPNKGKSSKARGTAAGGRRNAQVFREDEGIPEKLLERVQVKTFLWLKAKVKGCIFPFHEWQSCPTECAKAVKRHKRMRKQLYKEAAPPR